MKMRRANPSRHHPQSFISCLLACFVVIITATVTSNCDGGIFWPLPMMSCSSAGVSIFVGAMNNDDSGGGSGGGGSSRMRRPLNTDSEWAAFHDVQSTTVLPSTTSENNASCSDIDSDNESDNNANKKIECIDIAIVGGGIAGLTIAAGLEHIKDNDNNNSNSFSYKVYERAAKLRTKSQGMLTVRPVGVMTTILSGSPWQ